MLSGFALPFFTRKIAYAWAPARTAAYSAAPQMVPMKAQYAPGQLLIRHEGLRCIRHACAWHCTGPRWSGRD